MRPPISKYNNLKQQIRSIRAKFKRDYIKVLYLVKKLKKKVIKLQTERKKRYKYFTYCIKFIL